MFIDCRGRGGPTVILDAGLGVDSGTTWALVQPPVSRFARVCRYDRGGMGRSDPRPGPHRSEQMVAELKALLAAAHVRAPYVLVGASFGGLTMELFASEHPGDVAGRLLVDAIHPDLDRRIAPLLGHAGERARRTALDRAATRPREALPARALRPRARKPPPDRRGPSTRGDRRDPAGRGRRP
jgi:pimeloyl-ACP methyl ester carboxylesterase